MENNFDKTYLNMLNMENDRFSILEKEFNSKQIITQEDIIQLLKISFIDEFLAEFNYFASYNLSKTDGKNEFDEEFKQHEEEERSHKILITDRLNELNSPCPIDLIKDFYLLNSNGLKWEQEQDYNSYNILLRRLEEEKLAVKYYSFVIEIIDKMKTPDEKTKEILIKIVNDEKEHVEDLTELVNNFNNGQTNEENKI